MAASNNSISGIKNIQYFEDKYITFGKYSGESYKYIYENDKSYCNWLKLNVKKTNVDMMFFFEFLESQQNKQTIESNNIDYICNHFEYLKFFRDTKISFGKYLDCSYEFTYLKNKKYFSWMEEKNYLKKFDINFVDFFMKYRDENFIFPNIQKITLYNGYICLNELFDNFDDIYSVFFTINFYKKNNSNIIIYLDCVNNKESYHAKLIFFDKIKNIVIFDIHIEFHTSNFSFTINGNLSSVEKRILRNNLNHDFEGILKHQFNRMVENVFEYSIEKYYENRNNIIYTSLKKYLNEDVLSNIIEYL